MRKIMMGALVWLGVATLGACEIHEWSESGSVGDYGDEGWDDPYGSSGLCLDYCAQLESCGAIEFGQWDACVAVCENSFAEDPGGTANGCSCTLTQTCDEVISDPCDDTPIDPGGGAGGGGAGGGDAGGGDAGGGDPGGGGVGGDPGTGGGGGAIPCSASCECPEGWSCVDGFCAENEPPPPVCTSNCDCPAGQICDSGACVQP